MSKFDKHGMYVTHRPRQCGKTDEMQSREADRAAAMFCQNMAFHRNEVCKMPKAVVKVETGNHQVITILDGYTPMTPHEAEVLAKGLYDMAKKVREHNMGPRTKIGDY